MVVAHGLKGEIGLNNKLLWRLKGDMKHFKDVTEGKAVVMGRKTYESIGRPLPNRDNYVLTRDTAYVREGITILSSLSDVRELESKINKEVVIIGGGELYREFIGDVDVLYVTEVAGEFKADTYFPDITKYNFKKKYEKRYKKDKDNEYDFKVCKYALGGIKCLN